MADTGKKRLTKEFLKKLLRSDMKHYYSTPYLNETLYLHYKGFEKIENLEEFTGLKVLYLEGNGFDKIEGLDQCKDLKCLYLQENLIKKIENLDELTQLVNLNLTDNLIDSVEGLGKCQKLSTLQLKRNRLGKNGILDLKGLLECPSISVLDISDNYIDDDQILPEIFEKMSNLAVLYCQGNAFCKKIPSYRKTIIARLPNLKYLDDRPVFPEDRRFAEAFYKGGLEAERQERAKFKKEEEEKHLANHIAFREMVEKWKKEAEEAKAQEAQEAARGGGGEGEEQNQQINSSSQQERREEEEDRKSDTSADRGLNISIETSKLSTYNTEENASTPNSEASSRKRIDLNQLEENVSGSEQGTHKRLDESLDNNSSVKDELSRRASIDSNTRSIERNNDMIEGREINNENDQKETGSSQFDELEQVRK